MNDHKPLTQGVNHVGLAVFDLQSSTRFFTEVLGWTESGRDDSYPRTMVSDGCIRVTVGLHHLALEVASEEKLQGLAELLARQADVKIEFLPELLGGGPRKHMMCFEPGGIRIEFIWPGP